MQVRQLEFFDLAKIRDSCGRRGATRWPHGASCLVNNLCLDNRSGLQVSHTSMRHIHGLVVEEFNPLLPPSLELGQGFIIVPIFWINIG